MIKLENSWKIIAPAKTGEFKAHYFCKCGKQSTLALNNCDYPDYTCNNCHNDHFFTYEMFQDLQRNSYYENFNFNVTCNIIKNFSDYGYITSMYIPIYDTETTSVRFEKKELEKVSLALTKISLENDPSIVSECLDKKLYKQKVYRFYSSSRLEHTILHEIRTLLLNHLTQKDRKLMQKIKHFFPQNDKRSVLIVALFMFRNPHLQDVELVFFQKIFQKFTQITTLQGLFEEILKNSPKGVKRAFYQGYNDFFNIAPEYDYIIIKLFSDPNFVQKLLLVPVENKKLFIDNINLDVYLTTMYRLKDTFGQKKLFRLVKEALSQKDSLAKWLDTINMLIDANDDIDTILSELTLKRANLQIFHDEVLYVVNFYSNVKKSKIEFEDFHYPQEYFQLNGKYKGLEFQLVKNPKQLYEWAEVLHNCLSGYMRQVSRNITTILGVYVDGTITYAVEIKQNSLVQARAR